ncbi:MAG: hypothetical protein LBI87_10510, partial [Candidatus Accumulibacter sp.]|nr:hypothetical protein [Accumulibacter sp.]
MRSHGHVSTPPRKTRVCLALIAAFAAVPAVALAANNTILNNSANGGSAYDTDLYGNSGTTIPPSNADDASNNTLILGDGSAGPTLGPSSGSKGLNIYGGYAAGSSGNADNNT